MRHHRMRCTNPKLVATLILALGAGAGAGTARADEADATKKVISATAVIRPALDGSMDVTYGDQREISTLEDGSEIVSLTVPPIRTEEVSVDLCWDKKWDPAKNPKRIMYEPVPIAAEGGAGHVQYTFYPYRLEEARKYGRKWFRQYEVCARGLGQSDVDHWYMFTAGAAQADTNQLRNSRIGWDYRTGSTPPSYTLTYGFAQGSQLCGGTPAAKACSDSSISASIQQVKAGELRGGFKAPMGELQPYWKSGVAAWWDGKAIGGSPSFQSQGTIAHGLWEYAEDDPAGIQPAISLEVYAEFKCNRWLGFGCSLLQPA